MLLSRLTRFDLILGFYVILLANILLPFIKLCILLDGAASFSDLAWYLKSMNDNLVKY